MALHADILPLIRGLPDISGQKHPRSGTSCGQYAATPSMQGTITGNSDGSQMITFKCIKTAAATPYPPSSHQPMSPMSYSYRTDAELLQAREVISYVRLDCLRLEFGRARLEVRSSGGLWTRGNRLGTS